MFSYHNSVNVTYKKCYHKSVIIIDFLMFKKTTISLLYKLINLRDNCLVFFWSF